MGSECWTLLAPTVDSASAKSEGTGGRSAGFQNAGLRGRTVGPEELPTSFWRYICGI